MYFVSHALAAAHRVLLQIALEMNAKKKKRKNYTGSESHSPH
jgi:hypothetical protein